MTLVIGYGNPLRTDDAAGPEVARRLACARPDVEVLTPQQLVPELAASIARASTVVFIDAAIGGSPGTVQCDPVRPAHGSHVDHTMSPETLMALTREVFGFEPPGWLVRVHGERFDVGSSLSPVVHRAVPVALATALALMPDRQPDVSAP